MTRAAKKLPETMAFRPAFVGVDAHGAPRPRAWQVIDVEIDLRSGLWTETACLEVSGGGVLYRVLTAAGPSIVYVEKAT